ncbi:MAG: hypothetical protein ACOH2N_06090 [Devosia sp.]
MLWQIFAMWAIVMVTIAWFIRDERRLIANAALAQASYYYAQAPQYRYQSSEPPAPMVPANRTGGLTQTQREFMQAYAQTD